VAGEAGERAHPPAASAVRVRVPATSANLGPGFDTLGLALGLHDEVELGVGAGDRCTVEVEGEGAGRVPCDERHLVLRAAHATFDRAGAPRVPLRLRCRNVIPHSRGLGSSAAAAVAGIVGARALLAATHPLDDDAVLDLAAGFDGHADNVAACLVGGLVVSWGHEGAWRATRLTPHPALRPVALIAERSSSTEATRGLLPDRVPHADAAFTAARAALLVHALTSAPGLLLEATEDRLHQPYRRPAYPETAAVVDHLRAEGVPAVVSGAGPTVLALTLDGRLPGGLDTRGFTVRALDVDTDGARAEQL
jgi:homoserine kinase